MSILLPISTPAGSGQQVAAVAAGSTLVEGTLSVATNLAGQSHGSTAAAGSLAVEMVLEGLAASSTQPAGSLRINDEPNILFEAIVSGSTIASGSLSTDTGLVGLATGTSSAQGTLNIERAEELSFTFFVDIIDSDLSAALSNPADTRRFTSRLIVDGDAVPIIRATVNAPDGALGTELSVTLARADVSLVTADSSINFDIGVWVNDDWAWIPVLAGARMSGRGARYANQEGLPADAVEVTFVDIMGDRWNRAPRAQTILYDPQTVDAPAADTIASQTIYNGAGGSIVPIYTPIFGMRLRDVFHVAYVVGCGFDAVVSNIDNFPIEQVVFSITGGYDAGVRPLVSPFDPIFFVVENTLWIITLDNPLPAGFSAQDFDASNVESIDDQLPRREPANALLVHLKDDGIGEYFTERLDTKTESSGIFGTPGFTETDIERRVREYRNFVAPTTVTREEEVYIQSRTLDYQGNEISLESHTFNYDALNRPTGYTRSVSGLLPDLESDGALALQPSEEESQVITYGVHPLNPARDVQTRIVTTQSGLILTDNDNQYLDKPYKIPLHDAHKSGYVDPDADQHATFGPIRTITETLRLNGGQVVRDRQVMNHVANVKEPPQTQVLPGDASFDRRRDTGRTRTVLLTIAGTDASGRRVAEFDATGLPSSVGMKLAQKRLARLSNPPRELNAPMIFYDPMMRRGLDLNVFGRSGSLGTFIVRGYTGTFGRNAEGVVEGKMTIQARELQQ